MNSLFNVFKACIGTFHEAYLLFFSNVNVIYIVFL